MSEENVTNDLFYSEAYDYMYVPFRFSQRVVGHVILNFLNDNHFFMPPLYLVIEGSPGQGKTLQTIAACNKRRIAVKYVSASRLSGQKEGDSRKALEEIYKEAVELVSRKTYTCILIDDFHMGNAAVDDKTNHTINSNLLIGYMMNLAESINKCRIPIILTGNDFSNVYPALIRNGRADIFLWEPTHQEKFAIIRTLYEPVLRETSEKNLHNFFRKYSNENIAFFSQLINDWRRSYIDEIIINFDVVTEENLQRMSDEIHQKLPKITIQELNDLAIKRLNERRRSG